MWKLVEEEAFQQQLRGKEAAHMTQLADEWQKRDQQRQQLLKQKVGPIFIVHVLYVG